jgi:hypothetical protein
VRLFKSAAGLPPMAYLARLRAEYAANLLRRSDDSVAGIGRAVGWPDQNYFARRFRAHYGLTATTYRKRFPTTGVTHADGARSTPDPSGRGGWAPRAGQLLRGSSSGSRYSRPSGPIAVTWVTYSPDRAQWKCGVPPGRTMTAPGG